MTNDEKQKLKMLFDFQRFENNENLSKLINQSERLYNAELNDDELAFVNAAGEFEMTPGSTDGNRTIAEETIR